MQPGLLGPFPPAPGSGETAALEEASTVLVVPCPRCDAVAPAIAIVISA